MEQQLGDREGIKDTADLQARLSNQGLNQPTLVHMYFNGMKVNMELVTHHPGGHKGKWKRAKLPSAAAAIYF